MKIYEVTRTDEIGGLGKKIAQGAKAVGRRFMGKASRDAAYAADAGKEQTKEIATKLYTDWISIASSKGIDLPNPKKDIIMDPRTRKPVTDFSAKHVFFKGEGGKEIIPLSTFGLDGNTTYDQAIKKIQNWKPQVPTKAESIQQKLKENFEPEEKEQMITQLKREWFMQEVFNRKIKTQDLKLGAGYYFGKLRKFLEDHSIREGTLDKICQGVYPDVPISDNFEIEVYDNPRKLNKFLQRSFIKIAQKATNYHGTYYGSPLSNDPIAQAKGSVDPNLIDGLKDLSPAQKQAIAKILASGLGLKLTKGSASDASQQELNL